MKGQSEATVRAALTRLAEDMPMVVYKPPDDARNWKPADFLVWWGPDARESTRWQIRSSTVVRGIAPPKPGDVLPLSAGEQVEIIGIRPGSAMLEVKDNALVDTLAIKELRPNQRKSIREAMAIGLPYWLVVWWRRKQRWTVSDAAKVLTHIRDEEDRGKADHTYIPRAPTFSHLSSFMGVDCTTETLPGTIGVALRGELS